MESSPTKSSTDQQLSNAALLARVDKLEAQRRLALDSARLQAQYRLVQYLLGAVCALVLSPLAIGVFRRPADQVVQNISETALLLTGAAVNAIGMFMGAQLEKGRNENTTVHTIGPCPEREP